MTSVLFPYLITPAATYYTTYYATYYVLKYTGDILTNMAIDKTKNVVWFIISYPFKKREKQDQEKQDQEKQDQSQIKIECENDYVIVNL